MDWGMWLGLGGLVLGAVLVLVVLGKDRTRRTIVAVTPPVEVPASPTVAPGSVESALAGWNPFDDGPAPSAPGAAFDRWRRFGPSPRLTQAMDRLRGGLSGSAVLARLEDPHLHLAELERLIATDPVLTSTILRLANSPLYGRHEAVTDLGQSLGILGLTNIELVLHAELLEAAAIHCRLGALPRANLRRHLAVTAVIARHIAPAFPGLDPRTLHTLGILHDMGKLALYQNGETAFLPDLPTEIRAFGADHALTGALVCQGFGLPETLLSGIALHHAPQFVELEELTVGVQEITYALALCLADNLAHQWTDGPDGGGFDGLPGAGIPRYGVRDSYRFLVKVPILTGLIAAPALGVSVRQTLAMLRVLPGQTA